MAWGARNLISTQVLLGAGFAGRAVPRALPALRERARGAVLPLLKVGVRFSFELTKCVVVSCVFGELARAGAHPSGGGWEASWHSLGQRGDFEARLRQSEPRARSAKPARTTATTRLRSF